MAGRLLAAFLPYDLVTEPGGPGELLIIEPPERSLCGLLTLPYVAGREIDFLDLHVPTSGRFNQDDLGLLWDAGAELVAWRKERIALAREGATFGSPEIEGSTDVLHDWRSLAACAHDAAALLGRWPTVLSRRSAWAPVGIPGGTEDLRTTEREAERRGYLTIQEGHFQVTQSARWRGHPQPLVNATLAALALAVVHLTHASMAEVDRQLVQPLLRPIMTVARLGAAPTGHRDPDRSSWPVPFQAFGAACMRSIAALQSSRRGMGVLPLLDTDELYEAWLAVQVRRVLDAHFGHWRAPTSAALAEWASDEATYELWIKPRIDHSGLRFGRERFYAVVADVLTPDLLLTATREDETAVLALDAKAWHTLLPDDALSESAKYLYGIRRSGEPAGVPALAGVQLVTCAPRPHVHDADVASVWVTTATPTSDDAVLTGAVRDAANRLVAALHDRERLASGR